MESRVIYDPFEVRSLSDFHAELAFEYPALPEQLFDYYLLRTAIDMAHRGNLIRRRIVIHPQSGVTNYRLTPPDSSETELLHIMDVSAPDGVSLKRSINKAPFVTYDEHEQELNITHSFSCCTPKFVVEVSVAPKPKACHLPAEYYDRFLSTLLMGTKASILLITGRPWTSLQAGSAFKTEYLRSIAADALDVMSHRMRGGLHMNFGKVL